MPCHLLSSHLTNEVGDEVGDGWLKIFVQKSNFASHCFRASASGQSMALFDGILSIAAI